MALVDWNDSFSIGIETIDNQHKKLIEYINKTLEALNQGDIKITRAVIGALHAYTVEHFGIEEAFFKKINYEKIGEHLARHKIFVDKICYFGDNVEDNFETISIEMISYLSGWLMGHINTQDREYAPFWIEYYKNNA